MVFLLHRKQLEIAYLILSIKTYSISKFFLFDVFMEKVHPGLFFTPEISIGNYGREFLATRSGSDHFTAGTRRKIRGSA